MIKGVFSESGYSSHRSFLFATFIILERVDESDCGPLDCWVSRGALVSERLGVALNVSHQDILLVSIECLVSRASYESP
jgi:hypothetical protein